MSEKMEVQSSDEVSVNPTTFFARLKKLYDSWKESALWKGADAIVLTVNPEDGESKCSSVHIWMFDYELPSTITVFTKDAMHLLAGSKKAKIFDEAKSRIPAGFPQLNIMVKSRSDNTESFASLVRAIQSSGAGRTVGVLQKEMEGQNDTMIRAFLDSSVKTAGFEMADVTLAFSDLLSVKDDSELAFVREASSMSCRVMGDYLQNKIEGIVDNEKTVTHLKLAENTQDAMQDISKIFKKKKPAQEILNHLEIGHVPVIQSGPSCDLKIGSENSNDPLHAGTIVCTLGCRYRQYNSFIGRTFMIDPSKTEEKNYELLCKVQDHVISKLRPGVTLGEIYDSAADLVNKTREGKMAKYLTKTLGFGIGLEPVESYLTIKSKSTKVVRPNMVFCVSVGFENVPAEGTPKEKKDPKRENYSLLVADMVIVKETGDNEVLTSKHQKDLNQVTYNLDGDGEGEEEEEAQKKKKAAAAKAAAAVIIPSGENGPVLRKALRDHKKSTIGAEEERKKRQEEILMELRAEGGQKRKKSSDKGDKGWSMGKALLKGELVAYADTKALPEKLARNQVYVDQKADSILLPINGTHIPFHISTVKSSSISDEGKCLRVNFNVPGLGSQFAPAAEKKTSAFIKEVSFRSQVTAHISTIHKEITELIKKAKQKENEKRERSDLVEQASLQLQRSGGILRLAKVNVRPSTKGGTKKTVGDFEAHINGFRFATTHGESIDILYSNVKFAIFQPAEKETLVIIHIHLKHPILVGKKKQLDIQFYTEVMEEVEQLHGKFRRNMTDEEAILEEQREREMVQKLNKAFAEFCGKVEKKLESTGFKFDMPKRDLAFAGTPGKSEVMLMPTLNTLCSISEWPPFVMSMDDVELAHFERVSHGLRSFDMVFVFKDYAKPVIHINAVPIKEIEKIKDWLNTCRIKYFEGSRSLNWATILKTLREEDNWEPWSKDGWQSVLDMDAESSDEEQGSEGETSGPAAKGSAKQKRSESDDEDDNFSASGSEVMDSDSEEYASSEDFSEDEGSDAASLASDESEGKDWDELEEEAENDDKRRWESEEEDEKPARKRSRKN